MNNLRAQQLYLILPLMVAMGCKQPTLSKVMGCLQDAVGSEKSQGKVIARVGNQKITTEELNHALQQMPPQRRAMLADPLQRQNFIDGLVAQKVAVQLALDSKIDQTPEFNHSVQAYKESLLISLFRKRAVKDLPGFDMNAIEKDRSVKSITEIEMSHILVRTPQDAEKAMNLLKKRKTFAQVAAQLSVDKGSAQRGGKVGRIRIENADGLLEKTLLKLKDGQVAPPIKTDQGYQIIRRDKTHERIAIAPVEKNIQALRAEGQYIAGLIEEARRKSEIQIDNAALDEVLPLLPVTSTSE